MPEASLPPACLPVIESTMLSPRVQSLIIKCFSPEDATFAAELLAQYAEHFASSGWEIDNDRVLIAIIKTSFGSIDYLIGAITTAEQDWRDVLMNADFGYDIKAHLHWNPDSDGR